MIVEITQDIFQDQDFKGLNYLLQILSYKQRYQLVVEYTLISQTPTYNKLDESDKEEIEQSYNQFVNDGSPEPDYRVKKYSTNEQNIFNLEEAIRFFNQPVSIILENNLNDQPFLLAIIRHFDATGEIQRHINNGWLQFENAGGCDNVKNFITGKIQSFQSLPKINKSSYLRCFVLLDSDKTFPEDNPRPNKLNTEIFLAENEIAYHILHKRSMENYLPDDAFDLIPPNPERAGWIQNYKSLLPPQKDYINITKGFTKKKGNENLNTLTERLNFLQLENLINQEDFERVKDILREALLKTENRSDLKQGIQTLYQELTETIFDTLDKGLKWGDFKTLFPKLFEQTTKQQLEQRVEHHLNQDNKSELQNIISKITNLL